MNDINKEYRNYRVLETVEMEEGIMIVRPDNTEKHLAYINEDREVFFKDKHNLTNAEYSYVLYLAKTMNNSLLNKTFAKNPLIVEMEYHKEFTSAGYSGVLSKGWIVDRRIYPNAIPMQKNSMFGIPSPKINLK